MTTKERLRKYLEYKGINSNFFEKKIGFSNGFLKSGSSIQSDKIAIIIKNYPDLNLNWLISGEGEMLLSNYNNCDDCKNLVNEPVKEYNKTDVILLIKDMAEEIGRLKEENRILKKTSNNHTLHNSKS